MAIRYVCDNPQCGDTFHVEERPCYCSRCEPLASQWAGIEKDEMARNAEEFAAEMISKREAFFRGKTPNRPKPDEDGAVRGRSGAGKRSRAG